MPAGQGIDVPAIAQAVMDGVVAHYAPLAPAVTLPDRRVIVGGEPRTVAWDCESVLVTCGGIVYGQGPGVVTAGQGQRTGNPLGTVLRHTVMAVQIVRCVPAWDGTNPPDAAAVTTAGLALMRDTGLLSQALMELCGPNGALRRFGMAVAGAVEILGPAGGMAATEGNVQVTAGDLG